VADEVTRPRPEGEDDVHDIQVMISSAAHPTNVRSLKVGFLISHPVSQKYYTMTILCPEFETCM